MRHKSFCRRSVKNIKYCIKHQTSWTKKKIISCFAIGQTCGIKQLLSSITHPHPRKKKKKKIYMKYTFCQPTICRIISFDVDHSLAPNIPEKKKKEEKRFHRTRRNITFNGEHSQTSPEKNAFHHIWHPIVRGIKLFDVDHSSTSNMPRKKLVRDVFCNPTMCSILSSAFNHSYHYIPRKKTSCLAFDNVMCGIWYVLPKCSLQSPINITPPQNSIMSTIRQRAACIKSFDIHHS